MINKVKILLLIIVLNIQYINISNANSSYDTFFVVSAYYSPLPNQNHYLTWDYEKEIRLNWRWIRWASWKEVFTWMIAAPSKYKFWTKIQLEWLWVWSVEDRWWAIVPAGQRWYKYDRIDVWMWYWEEWLKRALNWGKKTVKWKILSSDSQVSIKVWKLPAPESAVRRLTKIPTVFDKWLWIKSNPLDIERLKIFLSEIWLYNWEINWIYSKDLIDLIYNFQIEHKLIKPNTNYWAGYWWNETRKKVLIMYRNWEFQKKNNTITYNWEKTSEKPKDIFSINIWEESSNENIKQLQKLFSEIWKYNWDIDWIYENIKENIISYQIEKWLIKHKSNRWAWYFWPKTRASVKKDYDLVIANKKEEEKKNEKIEIIKKEVEETVNEHISKIWTPKKWQVWVNIRLLQKTLKTLGHFEVKDSAIFWPITEQSLISYQLEKWIIKDKTTVWAWIYWPQTQKSIKEDLYEKLLSFRMKESDLVALK